MGNSCLLLEGQKRTRRNSSHVWVYLLCSLLYGVENSLIIVLETQVMDLDYFKKEINILEFLAK